MPQYDEDTRDKIVLLRGLRALRTPIEGPFELIKVEWPSPTGTKYYSVIDVGAEASVAPPVDVEVRLIPDNSPNWFLPIDIDSSIGDEEIELTFWDADDEFSDLVLEHGEGVRVTSLYWFPQVELLLPVWEGHLRNEEEGEIDVLKLKAVQGFRSSEASMPSRGHYEFCQAIFGGLFTTQEEIDEGGCNYNRHLSGSVGTLDPATGQPWTFCPRRSTSDCTARGVSPQRHLSHHTIVKTVVNAQSSGARLLSTSIGNETNLTEPVVVIMGTRRKYDMKVMVFRKDVNTNNPEHGFYAAFYEACEGPVSSITQVRIKVGDREQPANPATGFGVRLGNFGDASADNSLTTHGFSATAYVKDTYGWVDPSPIDPEDASANALIVGLRDIRVYGAIVAGQNGLLGTYYENVDFTGEVAQRVDAFINFPIQTLPPVEGMSDTIFWSVKWVGKIKPRYSELYTFKMTHDDGVKLIIDGVDVIDSLSDLGTHTGTIHLGADVLYDIEIQFKQQLSVWYVDLKWSSPSQVEEVVPYERLFLADDGDTAFVRQPTNNRVWQIARMLCDKRWGNGYDYDKLYIPSWIEAAAWVAEYVRFVDPEGTIWDHARGLSDVELVERKVQQQIEDMCLAGRLSRPFLFDGKLHIVPLRALTEDELDECPELTDEGENKNIIWEGDKDEEKTTLKRSQKSDLDLPNKIECTYDSAADDYKKTPLQPVEDIDAQLRAGRIIGDKSRKINSKKYHLLGVTGEAHAMKLQWGLLDLGPHDEGGLANNLRLTFKIWFLDAIDLHIAKVIKITSSKITKYGFTHFRILNMKRADNLHYELEVQGYNHAYMTAFETLISELPVRPTPPTLPEPPSPAPPQCVLEFGEVTYVDGVLDIPVPQCAGVTAVLDGGAPDTTFANVTDGGNSSQTFMSGYDGGSA